MVSLNFGSGHSFQVAKHKPINWDDTVLSRNREMLRSERLTQMGPRNTISVSYCTFDGRFGMYTTSDIVYQSFLPENPNRTSFIRFCTKLRLTTSNRTLAKKKSDFAQTAFCDTAFCVKFVATRRNRDWETRWGQTPDPTKKKIEFTIQFWHFKKNLIWPLQRCRAA